MGARLAYHAKNIYAVLLLVSVYQFAVAAEPCPVVGKLASVEGSVAVQRAGQESWAPGKPDQSLCQGDSIRVGERSRAAVFLITDAVLRLDERTTMRLTDIVEQKEKRSIIEMIIGAFQSFSRAPRSLAVNTPYVNGLIEGTEFLVRVEGEQTEITVFEGKVKAVNDHGQLILARGESAVAKKGEAPQPRIVVRPRDAVQWALYYPPVLSQDPAGAPSGLRAASAAAERGDTARAFAALESVPQGERDAAFLLQRAALLLSVGRVDEARADIERALALDPKAGLAHALHSVINVAQNQQEQALADGQRAVALEPQSASAHIALSYAQQAHFELEQARATLLKAVAAEPENALAWARLAELHSSLGNLDRALSAARRAATLEPNLARTQTVLGFAYLTQVKTTRARQAFDKAISLDQADPLPRLGLGLAKIREGHLREGRGEIELAAGLDPNNSLVRSYLGKAYFEEKRTPLAEREYATATELDANDPTPFFYGAIQKQTTNRPVEALRDVQQAIELNDNRAVYRSRLQLDSDLAARSASLGRVYSDLGFQQLALVEGWKSVNTDPSNYSAHRFLADSYSALPRHEIARVSELLQSQLLQPINTTPIQPRLAESNLFLISAGGPGGLSFNEFNPLFSRDGITLQTSALVGENDTYAGEGILAGIHDKTSFSVGGLHYATEGYRENGDQRDDIATVFVQQELTPDTSIQAEYRYREVERGDLQLRFFPEDFFPGLRDHLERHTFRLGGRHAFSPGSIVLGSFMYQDLDSQLTDTRPPEPFLNFIDILTPQTAFGFEPQYLFRSRYVNLRSGVGFFDIDGELDATLGLNLPPPPDGPGPIEAQSSEEADIRHINVYSYADVNLRSNLTATVGLSYDTLDSDLFAGDKDQFNPKFGITWEVIPGTTFRAAAFKVLKRTLITDQTLEPTQVAGFNQFFDDANLTESWRYGGAVDQVFTTSIFGGVEFSKRDLKVPFLDVSSDPANPVSRDVDWEEYLGRAYLFWTPHRWLALRAEYIFERFERDELFAFGVKEADTHRVPLGVSFFHASGLSAFVKSTYIDQEGEFELAAGGFQSGQDDFWLFDVGISYRLPKRHGFITVGAMNVFDEEFSYFDADLDNASIQPDRAAFARITLEIP